MNDQNICVVISPVVEKWFGVLQWLIFEHWIDVLHYGTPILCVLVFSFWNT